MSNKLTPEEVERSHRWHAVECNNLAWDLCGLRERSTQQADEMLNAAHASAYHWATIGTDLHQARSKMLLGHVYAALGRGKDALRYAQQSYDYLAAHEPPDWELAFAHAILAHAAFAAQDSELHQKHYARAEELGQVISDPEDKEIFFTTFQTIPGP